MHTMVIADCLVRHIWQRLRTAHLVSVAVHDSCLCEDESYLHAYLDVYQWYSLYCPKLSILCAFVQYDKVGKLSRDFEPYKNLWNTAADWMRWYDSWMNDALINIDPEILA